MSVLVPYFCPSGNNLVGLAALAPIIQLFVYSSRSIIHPCICVHAKYIIGLKKKL